MVAGEPQSGKLAPTILVVGDVMNDVLVRADGPVLAGADRPAAIRVMPGGSGANQAAWLGALGAPTVFAGRAGAADHADHVSALEACSVRPVLARDDDVPTGTVVALISADGERSFLTDRGANSRLCAADLDPTLLDGTALLHVSLYALQDERPREAVLGLMAKARQRGLPCSVDAATHSVLAALGPSSVLEWIAGAELLFVNAAEAAVLSGSREPDAQLAVLLRYCRTVIVKRGGRGALARRRDDGTWQAAAQPSAVVDTTGAGDAFVAGYLAAWLTGAALQGCLDAAVRLGSRAAAQVGARPLPPARGRRLAAPDAASSGAGP